MRAVDTNVLVRIIVRDDARQARAADAFIENGAWISILALAETMWVLTAVYRRTATEVAAALEMLLSHEKLILQDSEVVASALDLFRSRPALGLSDCLMLQLARKAGHLPLGTFRSPPRQSAGRPPAITLRDQSTAPGAFFIGGKNPG